MGWLEHLSYNCGEKDKSESQFFLDTLEKGEVMETRELEMSKALDVDPSLYTYNLRVEVDNHADCSAHELKVGVLAIP